jgi:glycosyltransferase involved in cell wall biosynthesis
VAVEPDAEANGQDGAETVNGEPLVSVVLPCYDAERFLAQALESLLGQTYDRLEVLAIDDGSSDGTPRILEEFAARDERVRSLRNPENQGVIATLNRGVSEARGAIVARMDADDVAAPTRIERQVEVLAGRPEIDLVGTGVEVVDGGTGRRLRPRPVRCLGPGGARFAALFTTPAMHMTIAARAETMRAHPYGGTPDSLHTEDYEMFARMLDEGSGICNIDEPLMTVRSDPGSVSARHEEVQVENFVRCSARHLERTLGLQPEPAAQRALVNRIDGTVGARDLREGLRWLDRVEREFLRREPGAAAEARRSADLQRVDILVQAALKGSPAVRCAAAPLALRHGRRLLSPPARRYLAGKLRRSRSMAVNSARPGRAGTGPARG